MKNKSMVLKLHGWLLKSKKSIQLFKGFHLCKSLTNTIGSLALKIVRASFFEQFSRLVCKADYLTLRHGFIAVHFAPGSKFNFQKYIKRSLEDDFKVMVGISPLLWATVVIFLLVNINEWQSLFWASIPLVIILVVGTKLQLVLHLLHFAMFQNAIQITYILWTWYAFGLRSCSHKNFKFAAVRLVLGVAAQLLCSYITLPLYALVTQMGSTAKKSIFDEQTSKAIKQWHMAAMKKKVERAGRSPTRCSIGGGPSVSPMQSPARMEQGEIDHQLHQQPT